MIQGIENHRKPNMQFQPLQLLLVVCHLHPPHTKSSTDNSYKFEHQNLIKSTDPYNEKTFNLTIQFESEFNNQFESKFLKYKKTRKAKEKFASLFCCHENFTFITLSVFDLRLLW